MKSSELAELRGEIEQLADTEPIDILDRVSRDNLVTAFNDLAPRQMQLGAAGPVALRVAGEKPGPLASKDLSELTGHVARAVAMIGHELAVPSASARLRPSDYQTSPVYTTSTPAGLMVFTAGRGAVVINGETIESQAERAMTRLANLLPTLADDAETIANRIGGLRQPSAKAVHEMALAAKMMRGITVELHGSPDDVDAILTYDQANDLDDWLTDLSETVEPFTATGELDGVRRSRRLFYLERDHEADIPFTVDEDQLDHVQDYLGSRVIAHLERVMRRKRNGDAHRPSYRLLRLETAVDAPTDRELPADE